MEKEDAAMMTRLRAPSDHMEKEGEAAVASSDHMAKEGVAPQKPPPEPDGFCCIDRTTVEDTHSMESEV